MSNREAPTSSDCTTLATGRKQKLFSLVPFLVASILGSLAATFHSTQIGHRQLDESSQIRTSNLSKNTVLHLRSPTSHNGSDSESNDSQRRWILGLKLQEQATFKRNEFTFDSFEVAGVNLAQFGFQDDDKDTTSSSKMTNLTTKTKQQESPFQLFDDFDLSSQLVGNESWVDLIGYRRDAEFKSLSFYVDKIARKRWLPSTGLDDGLEPFVLKYGSELIAGHDNSGGNDRDGDYGKHAPLIEEEQRRALLKLLPVNTDYAAKPTHLSCAGGVWLTKNVGNTTFIGNGKKQMKANPDFSIDMVAKDLAAQLQRVQESCGKRVKESLALQHVKPGIVVEERFTSLEEEDNRGGMEFKVFTIWGRMWLAIWRPGMDGAVAIIHRNGTNLEWEGMSESLPEWIDWQRIVDIAERSGIGKDMFRTDIFVGVSSGSTVLANGTSNEDRLKAVRYVISESEIHPTEYFHVKGTKQIFNEGGRLWLAGYAKGNYRVVPNTEVPSAFVDKGFLPAN